MNRMNLEIGQVVYTCYGTGLGSEVEIVTIPAEQKKPSFSIRRDKTWIWSVKPLRSFSYKGWEPYQNRPDGRPKPEVVNVLQENMYLTLGEVMPLLEQSLKKSQDALKLERIRINQLKARLLTDLEDVVQAEKVLATTNIAAVLGLDTYISPFTGKVM